MSEKLARVLFSDAHALKSELAESGWISSDSIQVDSRSPIDLFTTEERPLVVGLFGGTGVGKSSLLNRLAGADIARTGVVRPTSMEITAYLHRDIQLGELPRHFSAERFSDNRHEVDRFANVMWVDMPDFDSAETENRDQVLQWLGHIDLLIYVVTPERYKDAEGWRMMLENGYRHAWLFVMNQWDRAEPVQYQDFVSLLEVAGFKNPQVFRTVCVGDHDEDEFSPMLNLIESLANHNVMEHLRERGWMQRLSTVEALLKEHSSTLTNTGNKGIEASFNEHWQAFESTAVAHLDTPFKTHSALFADEKTGTVMTMLKSLGPTGSTTDVANNIAVRSKTNELWDDWLSVRLQDSVSEFRLAEQDHGVPAAVISAMPGMSALVDIENVKINSTMTSHFDRSVAAAIETPGPLWQRLVVTAASWLKILLPVMALLWVTWRVVNGFVAGADDRSAYVGLDFMVNGVLLAGLGWLIPMIVQKVMTPSLPDAIYRSLHHGLHNALAEIKQSSVADIERIKADRNRYQSASQKLETDISHLIGASEKPQDPNLKNILMAASGIN